MTYLALYLALQLPLGMIVGRCFSIANPPSLNERDQHSRTHDPRRLRLAQGDGQLSFHDRETYPNG
jgi:hypothetical protein